MPIYEYECVNCGELSEFLFQESNSISEIQCTNCGSHNLVRKISVPGLLKKTPSQRSTCCGRVERCESPPCSTTGQCRRH